MGQKKLPLIEKIRITDIGARGKAIARIDNFVTFVSNGLPGDIVDLQITRRKKSFQEGKVVRFHERSELRTEPFCKHFGHCGGCRWQDLKYTEQLHYKQQEVTENLKRISQLELPDVNTIKASVCERYYRNKLEFSFSNRRWLTPEEIVSGEELSDRNGLGFHLPGLFDKVIDLHECHLQPVLSNSIRQEIRDYAREHRLGFYDLKKGGGLLRTLVIRNTLKGEWMVLLVFFEKDEVQMERLLNHIQNRFPEITSLMYCINRKANDSLFDQEILVHAGRDHIIEELEDLPLNLLKLSEFRSLSDFIATPSMNVNRQAYFDKAFSALGSVMNGNAGGMLKAWLDEICLKFRSIRKQHQSHSERLRVLECALCDDHSCIPLLLWHKNHTAEKLIYFKSVFIPFMDISQFSLAENGENVNFEDDDEIVSEPE